MASNIGNGYNDSVEDIDEESSMHQQVEDEDLIIHSNSMQS